MTKTLREIREKRKLTLAEVAREVGTDAGNLSRIETGSQVPSRDLARGLYAFYDGKVSLAAIYDPGAQIA
ncbi:hypothetical protein LCGC14_2627940 [marine sediment metagenome]|uniref:HTH cro/C1-type domain-containing protein n=1 Tax=marine sediment metagenome TaxID=412755 RepID=A0A0F9CC90_9ZZZZ